MPISNSKTLTNADLPKRTLMDRQPEPRLALTTEESQHLLTADEDSVTLAQASEQQSSWPDSQQDRRGGQPAQPTVQPPARTLLEDDRVTLLGNPPRRDKSAA
jgi:hypothetical protein